jgi:hypothetical protein
LPTFAPAITAVVNPAKTRTNVPNNSAAYFIMTFTSGEFRCQNKQLSHAKILVIVAANSTCKKHQRKCQREFYMAQSVLARIRTGAKYSFVDRLSLRPETRKTGAFRGPGAMTSYPRV